jgi:hypothetical protein
MLPIGGDRGGLKDFSDDISRLRTPVGQALPGISQLTPPAATLQSPPGSLPMLTAGGLPPGLTSSAMATQAALAGLPVGVVQPPPDQTQAYYEQAAANTLGLAGRPLMGGVMECVFSFLVTVLFPHFINVRTTWHFLIVR